MSADTKVEFARRFPTFSRDEQIEQLAALGWKLTLEGRSTYEAGTEQVLQPTKLRRVNEAHHLIFTHLRDLLSGTSERYPDEVIAQALVELVAAVQETDQ